MNARTLGTKVFHRRSPSRDASVDPLAPFNGIRSWSFLSWVTQLEVPVTATAGGSGDAVVSYGTALLMQPKQIMQLLKRDFKWHWEEMFMDHYRASISALSLEVLT